MGRIGEIGAMGFVEHLLPIIDHFDLAIAHVPEESKAQDWAQGFFHIKKHFFCIYVAINRAFFFFVFLLTSIFLELEVLPALQW